MGARQLIGEEMALRQLRKARMLTQEQVARTLKIGQDGVSRLESRSDFLISTLQSYVKAMGGEQPVTAGSIAVDQPDAEGVFQHSIMNEC